jgi:hypothetical protein
MTAAGPQVYPDEMDKGATYANHISIGRMLFRWQRSVYRVVYKEPVTFLLLFGIISAIYRYVVNENQKK